MASFQDQISELSDQVFEKLNINTFPLVPVDESRREYEENKVKFVSTWIRKSLRL